MRFIPRQYLYLLIVSTILLILLLLFSIDYIVPSGKQYRKQQLAMQTLSNRVEKLYPVKTKIQARYDIFVKEHKDILVSFDKDFDIGKFIETNRKYFQKITLTKLKKEKQFNIFDTYKVDAVSTIQSPINFYNFLQHVNNEGWIMKVEFPIHFQREQNLIDLDFTIRVYRHFLKNKSSNIPKSS